MIKATMSTKSRHSIQTPSQMDCDAHAALVKTKCIFPPLYLPHIVKPKHTKNGFKIWTPTNRTSLRKIRNSAILFMPRKSWLEKWNWNSRVKPWLSIIWRKNSPRLSVVVAHRCRHPHPRTICWCFRKLTVLRPDGKSSFFTYVYSYFSFFFFVVYLEPFYQNERHNQYRRPAFK